MASVSNRKLCVLIFFVLTAVAVVVMVIFSSVIPVTSIYKIVQKISRLNHVDKPVSSKHEITRETFEKHVTIMVYSHSKTGHCILSQFDDIRKVFRRIHIVAYPSMDLNVIGYYYDRMTLKSGLTNLREVTSLNVMLSYVETEYVLYLPRGSTVADFDSSASPKWLLDILHKEPQVDIAGGVIKWPGTSNVDDQCSNPYGQETLKLQEKVASYKQQSDYSVCNTTSPAFMARTSAMWNEIGTFDADQSSGVIAEFFRRANEISAKIAHLRHVVFSISDTCVKNNLGDRAA